MDINDRIKAMTVSEIVDNIGKKELKVKDVAEVLGKSEKTVSKKISSLGYVWEFKSAMYLPTGEAYSPENDTKLFVELFDASPIKKAVKASQEVKEARKEVASHLESSTVKSSAKSFDAIDSILFGKPEARVQRAYYMDKDLADIIDKVDGKQKSNLINECIRKVFKEKGIL